MTRNLPLAVIVIATLIVMVCIVGPVAVHAAAALHNAGSSV